MALDRPLDLEVGFGMRRFWIVRSPIAVTQVGSVSKRRIGVTQVGSVSKCRIGVTQVGSVSKRRIGVTQVGSVCSVDGYAIAPRRTAMT